MEKSHLQELIELEDSYWWHVAKRQLVLSLLEKYAPPPGKLVEGGIGSGRNLLEFQSRNYEVSGFDVMPEAVEHARSLGLADTHLHNLEDPWPLESKSVDAVVMLDVIEHLENPVKVLRHAAATLREEGVIVITVPAHPWLYGEWDKRLGHYRRYTKAMFRAQAKEAELKIQWLQPWNAFSFPPACLIRGYQRIFKRDRAPEFPRVNPLVNSTLLTLARMERWCMQKVSVPIGLSLAGVLSK